MQHDAPQGGKAYCVAALWCDTGDKLRLCPVRVIKCWPRTRGSHHVLRWQRCVCLHDPGLDVDVGYWFKRRKMHLRLRLRWAQCRAECGGTYGERGVGVLAAFCTHYLL